MFGFGQVSTATTFCTEAMVQILAPFQISGGIPNGFWRDPYAIGYMQGVIGLLAKLRSNGALSGGKLGKVNMNVFENLNPGRGLQTITLANDFFAENNPDYLDGIDKGSMTVAVTYGSHAFDDNDLLAKAREMARQTATDLGNTGPVGPAEIGGMLQFICFHQEMKMRLGTGDSK